MIKNTITSILIAIFCSCFVPITQAQVEEEGGFQMKPIDTQDYDGSIDIPHPVRRVILDPGHGGRDEGCEGASSMEKHINLEIAKKLGKKIKSGFSDVKVIYTRRSDIYVPLGDRAELANFHQGDLLISIHCNALRQKKVHGAEIYVLGEDDEDISEVAQRENEAAGALARSKVTNFGQAYRAKSRQIATKVERELQAVGRKSLGIKEEPFIVLKMSDMPGVLIESGFLTNKKEEKFLLSDAGQEQIAEAIWLAFAEYKNENEVEIVAVTPTETTPEVAPETPKIPENVLLSPPTPAPARPSIASGVVSLPPASPYLPIGGFNRQISRVNLPQMKVSDDVLAILLEDADFDEATDFKPTFRTEYKVQLGMSSTPIDETSLPWSAVFHLEKEQISGTTYYLAGGYWDYQSAVKGEKYWRNNGFPNALIITYKNGVRVQ